MIAPKDVFRCTVCGLEASVEDKNIITISGVFNSNTIVKACWPPMDVCNKCLPNLMVMIERAIINTSKLMVAENTGVRLCQML